MAYNKERVKESELPRSVLGLTAPRWRGKVGWAPTNASFERPARARNDLDPVREIVRAR